MWKANREFTCFVLLCCLCLTLAVDVGKPLSAVELDLGGTWNVANSHGNVSVPATVPGQIQLDLFDAKIIDDPYYRYNDVKYRWVLWDDWTYSRSFTVTADLLKQTQIFLQCDGLQTIASIYINTVKIGDSDNMFRRYIFEVPSYILQEGSNNQIVVVFTSTARYVNDRAKLTPYDIPTADNEGLQSGEYNRNYARTEQCSFSWDWGPCFIPQGIWLPIKIIGYTSPLITEVTPQTYVIGPEGSKDFTVNVTTFLHVPSSGVPVSGVLTVSVAGVSLSNNVYLTPGENAISVTLIVQNVGLWWPSGYGAPILYTLEVTFKDDTFDQTVTSYRRVGFRSVKLVTDAYNNQTGNAMYFRVNGIPIFAKGSNWIPADSFERRVTKEVLANLLSSAYAANMNIIRNWGGGIYQHDYFYDFCDANGIMVWEEFMFACAMYPRDSEFLDTISKEVRYQVRRLTFHPSIILWSGSNENEAALEWFDQTTNNPHLYTTDYSKLYFDTVRGALVQEDQSRSFWPSSPSNGIIEEDPYVGIWGNPYNSTQGDLHYYNYDAYCTNYSSLPATRFASEYGYQSFPSTVTWAEASSPSEDWSPFSDLMQHRQHHPDGTNEVVGQIQNLFNYVNTSKVSVENFEHFVYLSQLTQATCIKFESEFYRRSKSTPQNTMGAIYWQLNDIWQAPTWSSLEYGGRWKALHYFVKHFFAPVLVSSFEYPEDHLEVHVTSDWVLPLKGSLQIRLIAYNSGSVLNTWNIPANIAGLYSQAVFQANISSMIAGRCANRASCFLDFTLKDGENVVSYNFFYLSMIKEVDLKRPTISRVIAPGSKAREAIVKIQSDAVTPYVFLETAIRGRFSDNAVLLLPNVPQQIVFYGWEDFSEEQLEKSLVVRLLTDNQ